MEIDLNVDRDPDGPAIFVSGLKAPLTDRFDGLLVEAHAERLRDTFAAAGMEDRVRWLEAGKAVGIAM